MNEILNIPNGCYKNQHKWNGVLPIVNVDLLQVQNEELINKPCDCGKYIYTEQECGCSVKKWEIKFEQNKNYIPNY